MKNARQKSGENVLARLGVGTVHPSRFFFFTTLDAITSSSEVRFKCSLTLWKYL